LDLNPDPDGLQVGLFVPFMFSPYLGKSFSNSAQFSIYVSSVMDQDLGFSIQRWFPDPDLTLKLKNLEFKI